MKTHYYTHLACVLANISRTKHGIVNFLTVLLVLCCTFIISNVLHGNMLQYIGGWSIRVNGTKSHGNKIVTIIILHKMNDMIGEILCLPLQFDHPKIIFSSFGVVSGMDFGSFDIDWDVF